MKIKLPISKIRLLRMVQMNISSDAMCLFGYKQLVKQIANIHLTLSQIRSSLRACICLMIALYPNLPETYSKEQYFRKSCNSP